MPVQIAEWLRGHIACANLRPGDHLPSTRSLARTLGVSRGTVVAAYEQLAAEGYVEGAQGAGTRINPALAQVHPLPAPKPKAKPATPSVTVLRPGAPDAAALATSSWRAAWRQAVAAPLQELEPLGSWELRVQIAEHLRHMRGVAADPSHILISAGAREGLGMVLRALDVETVAVEQPGFPGLRRVFGHHGCKLVDAPMDAHGILPAQVPQAEALLVTPSHQYPYGGALGAQRRHELVQWARSNDAWLIEDDHDSELRYTGQPLPALHALDPTRTILLGTFSALLTPALAVGYVVLPAALVDKVTQTRRELGSPVGAIPQLALAAYLESGALRRHTQSRRRVYRRRRDMVQAALGDLSGDGGGVGAVGGVELMPISGGLHAVLLCERPSAEVVEACAQGGYGVVPLEGYWGGSGEGVAAGRAGHEGRDGREGREGQLNGVVFGFGSCSDAVLADALEVIRGALLGSR
nr:MULTISPECIES: PLP-dependent aminotransferase family protein [unclassified Corynebacterium]